MKQTIRIRPKHSKNIVLQGSYLHKTLKRMVYLTRGGDVVRDRDLLPTERVENIGFTQAKTEHVIEWDVDTNSAEGRSRVGKDNAIKLFFEEHPHMEIVGGNNKFMQQDFFTFENINDITERNVTEIKEKLRIANIIQSYDYATQKDVSFAFGGNPTDMTQAEVFVDLLHGETGRALLNWDTFEKKWNPELNKDISYVVIAKKAIAFGIIETRNNNYVLGQEIVGAGDNFDSVVGYLKVSPSRFEFVKHEVQLKDMPKEVKKASLADAEGKGKISERLTELRKEAKDLGVKGWQIDSEKTLEAKIDNAKKVKAKGPLVIDDAEADNK